MCELTVCVYLNLKLSLEGSIKSSELNLNMSVMKKLFYYCIILTIFTIVILSGNNNNNNHKPKHI